MINDLKSRWYEQVILWVEPVELENKQIYFHYGFNELVKTDVEPNPDWSLVTVEYYKKNI